MVKLRAIEVAKFWCYIDSNVTTKVTKVTNRELYGGSVLVGYKGNEISTSCRYSNSNFIEAINLKSYGTMACEFVLGQ